MRPLLASRTIPGLTIPLAIPSGDARLQLLRELSIHHSVDLDDELIEMLHRRIDSRLSARSLESAIKQISLWCRMHDSPPSIEAVEHAIETVGKAEEISLAEITAAVAKYFRLRRTELRSSSRKQTLVRARSLAMFLGRRLTSKSMHQIGDYFGGRDHTTVLHAIRKTDSLLEQESELRRAADEIQEKLVSP
jgi:chromosomal replication initiator protein